MMYFSEFLIYWFWTKVSELLYWAGELISIPLEWEIEYKDRVYFPFFWLYYPYNWLMLKSFHIHNKHNLGVWDEEE